MRYGLILSLLVAAQCWSQSTATGNASTTGSCSPAVTGSNNQFTITCQGIPDNKFRTQLVDLLNRIAANQANAETMMSKLDACVAGLTPRHLTAAQRENIVRALLPFREQRLGTIVNNSKRETREYFEDLKDALTAAGWNIYERGVWISGPEPLGVDVRVGEKDVALPAVQALVNTLNTVGANARLIYDPVGLPENKTMFGSIKSGEIMLWVGDRP